MLSNLVFCKSASTVSEGDGEAGVKNIWEVVGRGVD